MGNRLLQVWLATAAVLAAASGASDGSDGIQTGHGAWLPRDADAGARHTWDVSASPGMGLPEGDQCPWTANRQGAVSAVRFARVGRGGPTGPGENSATMPGERKTSSRDAEFLAIAALLLAIASGHPSVSGTTPSGMELAPAEPPASLPSQPGSGWADTIGEGSLDSRASYLTLFELGASGPPRRSARCETQGDGDAATSTPEPVPASLLVLGAGLVALLRRKHCRSGRRTSSMPGSG